MEQLTINNKLYNIYNIDDVAEAVENECSVELANVLKIIVKENNEQIADNAEWECSERMQGAFNAQLSIMKHDIICDLNFIKQIAETAQENLDEADTETVNKWIYTVIEKIQKLSENIMLIDSEDY